uniref:Valacyclovir hydrolase n=1 Tax=Claviceps paspali TaxID=40601 RepID=J7FIJ5_CLAPA|nr:valacyclovir hydrolase [Claviceps paspali]
MAFRSNNSNLVVLSRLRAAATAASPIPGPPESVFTETFGVLLPAATYVSTGKGKFAYYDLKASSPSADAHRVLMIHGIQTPALGLLPLAQRLRASFPQSHFILLDLWGHGLSDTPRVPHTPDLFLEQVDALLDHLSWSSAHLVGYSLGSTIVAGYTATRAARVESLVLVAPAGLFSLDDFPPEQQALLRGDEGVDGAASLDFIVSFLEGGELVVPHDAEERIARGEVVAEAMRSWQMRFHDGHAASVMAIVHEGALVDREEMFRKASSTGKPRMAVLGELDDLSSREKVMRVGVENVVVIPGARHDVVRQQADEVGHVIGVFWRNKGQQSGQC